MENNNNMQFLSAELEKKQADANRKYNILLDQWRDDDRNIVYPDYYGGGYLDDNKSFVMNITEPEEQVRTNFEGIISLDNITFKQVKYSYSTLLSKQKELTAKMKELGEICQAEIIGVGVVSNGNGLLVQVKVQDFEKRKEDLHRNIKNALGGFENIILESCSGIEECSTTLYLGTKILNYNSLEASWSGRSIGLWCKVDNKIGILTSPHNSIKEGDNIYISSNSVFGVATTPYYNNLIDAVFIERTNANYTYTNKVNGWDVQLVDDSYSTLPDSLENTTVYAEGYTTGNISGTIKSIAYDTSKFTDNVLTTAQCNLGDSGGVVFVDSNGNGRYLMAGLIRAKVGTDDVPGDMIFCKYKNIRQSISITRLPN